MHADDLVAHSLHFMLIFFFNDTATTEIYTLSLHDALPISPTCSSTTRPTAASRAPSRPRPTASSSTAALSRATPLGTQDRKSTRLNSSHANISYAVFCLKKKNKKALLHSLILLASHHISIQ